LRERAWLARTTSYARSGDAHIAYQVYGDGPLDLILVWGTMSHVELLWEDPLCAHFLEQLASFSRLILFDKRGCGLSDRVVGQPTLEQRMDDVRAVMDAVGSERAALIGESEGGPMSMLFAASFPQRTVAPAALRGGGQGGDNRGLALGGEHPGGVRGSDGGTARALEHCALVAEDLRSEVG
jgi:pimeloyl-ACP methyl ester carboxylesterase